VEIMCRVVADGGQRGEVLLLDVDDLDRLAGGQDHAADVVAVLGRLAHGGSGRVLTAISSDATAWNLNAL
jgi:hypothetical protein